VRIEIGTDFYIGLDETSVRITGIKTVKKSPLRASSSSDLSKLPAISSDAVTRFYRAP
jgi:hypothetical protein